MIDQDTTNETILESIEGDFDTFLGNRDWEGCNVVIDNLRDMGKYEKAKQLLVRLHARKMTVPADYGEGDYDRGVMDGKVTVIKTVIEHGAETLGVTPSEFLKECDEQKEVTEEIW